MEKNEIIEEVLSHKCDLHYTEIADAMLTLSNDMSERKIAKSTEYSKSEVHRLLVISALDIQIKNKAKEKNIQKYVLLDYAEQSPRVRSDMYEVMISGQITTRRQFKNNLKRFL